MTEVRLRKKKKTDVERREWREKTKQKRGARGSSSVWKLSFLFLYSYPPPLGLSPSAGGGVKLLPEADVPTRTVL
jgi:hypothetical protein